MEAGNLKKSEMSVVKSRLISKTENKKNGSFFSGITSVFSGSFFGEAAMVFLAVFSIFAVFISSYEVEIDMLKFCLILLVFSLAFTFYYEDDRSFKVKIISVLLIIGVSLILLFLTGDMVMEGLVGVVNDVINCINSNYNGSIDNLMYEDTMGEKYRTLVLAYISFFAVWFVARGIILRRDCLHFVFVAFPFMLISLISGGNISKLYLLIMLICFVNMMFMSKVRIRKKFLGIENPEIYGSNKRLQSRIRLKVSVLGSIVCIISVIFSIFFVEMGRLPFENALSGKMLTVRTEGIRFLADFLPKISGGKLHFSIEGVGGGSSGGLLGEVEGTYYKKEEMLKIICDELPKETIYLRGFIGNVYTGKSWEGTDEEIFIANAENWIDEENVSLYIKNLPFLRGMYTVNSEDISNEEIKGYEPDFMKIEYMSENHSYTYVPYNAYLNDYYVIEDGDGSVKSQDRYDDSFNYISVNDYEDIMYEWKKYGRQGILDEIEGSYNYYVSRTDVEIGEVDLSMLYELCRDKSEEWDSKFNENMTKQQVYDLTLEKYEDVKNFVRRTLLESCTFQEKAVKLPKDKDFINYFMFEKKTGDSTAFASAAVMMFRMCGIPARYVEGYVVPSNIFSYNDENYTAVIQDDNAHAWVEIYVPYIGWNYVETTPGFDGTVSNLPMPEDDNKDNSNNTGVENEDINENEKDSVYEIFARYKGFLILGVMVFVCLVIRYIILKERHKGNGRKSDNSYRIKHIFYSIYEMLIYSGFDRNIDTTKEEFITEVLRLYPDINENDLRKYMEILIVTHYGRKEPEKYEADFSLDMYNVFKEKISKNLKSNKKIVFYLWKAF